MNPAQSGGRSGHAEQNSRSQQSRSNPIPATPLQFSSHTLLIFTFTFLIMIFATPVSARASECLSIDEAPSHIGQMACVTGKVLSVGEGRSTHFLEFCGSYRRCPFSVVIFKKDLKDASLLKKFPGNTIRIYGPIQQYNGRAEIVLKLEEQLSGQPGPYADALKPRQPRDRRAPAHPGSGTLSEH